jgi:tetratricopeptide (TPR) repeat protein
MDAKTLFQEGVVAIRDQRDLSKGRDLLLQSLKLEPQNEMGWLWLSRTMNEPQKKIQCLERALKINPNNDQTKILMQKLSGAAPLQRNGVRTAASHASVVNGDSEESVAPRQHTSTESIALAEVDSNLDLPLSAPTAPSNGHSELGATKSVIDTATLTPKLPIGEMEAFNNKLARGKAAKKDKLETPSPRAENPQIKGLMSKAQALLDKNEVEGAIEQWVRVLEIEVDHETALANAVRHLSRLKYIDDARELVWNALNAGTTHPSVYLTAIDIAKYQGHDGEADEMRLKLVQQPEAGEKTVLSVVEHFSGNQPQKALEALDLAIPHYPKNQKMALRRAQLAEELGLRKEAALYYEEVARLGSRTKEGKVADTKLDKFVPHMTDKERGSSLLAVREAFGVGFLYLLMGWQDAGLNLLNLGLPRLGGIILSIIGGYLLVTGTSSPQQKPLATWLGGRVPEKRPPEKKDAFEEATGEPEDITEIPIIPNAVRVTMALVGIALLIGAFALVFSMSIGLFRNPTPPSFYVPTLEELLREQP